MVLFCCFKCSQRGVEKPFYGFVMNQNILVMVIAGKFFLMYPEVGKLTFECHLTPPLFFGISETDEE